MVNDGKGDQKLVIKELHAPLQKGSYKWTKRDGKNEIKRTS